MNKLLIIFLLFSSVAQAAAPARQFNYVSQTVIDPAQVNANENSLYNYLQLGVDTYTAGSISNAAVSGTAAIIYSKLNLTGGIVNTDIASSAAIAASKLALGGVVLPSGAIFYMLTGSCPSGTTDVSATYPNKFIKTNSTQGTSSGVVLTATTDSHTLIASEIPALLLTRTQSNGAGGGTAAAYTVANASDGTTSLVNVSGSGNGHTHTISSAATLEPSSITAKLCSVN